MSSEFAPSTSSIDVRWFFGLALMLLIFAAIAFYSKQVTVHTTGYDAEQAQIRYARLAKLREADQLTLTTADWVDQDKQIVRIPIDEAIPETIAELQAKPVTMCPSTAPAAPAAAPAPAATNAAPAAPAPPAKTDQAPAKKTTSQ